MPRSVYVPGVPFPSSKQQQQLDIAARLQQQQSHGQQQQAYGAGVAQLQYNGKPAFFDSNRGIYFDGQRANYVFDDNAATAIDAQDGYQSGQQQPIYGQGYGVRVPLIQRLQQELYQGKPAFYDPVHGVFYDGKQAYLYVPTDNTSTAVELNSFSGQSGGQEFYGQGYGNRVLLSLQEVPLQLQGKPAFFDSHRGLFFDGQNLYSYQPAQQSELLTAVELSSGQPRNYSVSTPQQRARYQQLVQDLNENRSVYLFSV